MQNAKSKQIMQERFVDYVSHPMINCSVKSNLWQMMYCYWLILSSSSSSPKTDQITSNNLFVARTTAATQLRSFPTLVSVYLRKESQF